MGDRLVVVGPDQGNQRQVLHPTSMPTPRAERDHALLSRRGETALDQDRGADDQAGAGRHQALGDPGLVDHLDVEQVVGVHIGHECRRRRPGRLLGHLRVGVAGGDADDARAGLGQGPDREVPTVQVPVEVGGDLVEERTALDLLAVRRQQAVDGRQEADLGLGRLRGREEATAAYES